jgi:hypothetical protein
VGYLILLYVLYSIFLHLLILCRFVESLLPNYQLVVKLLKDNDFLRLAIPEFVEEMRLYQKNFCVAFNFISMIQHALNEPSMRKPEYYLYLIALQEENGLGESDYVKSVISHLRYILNALASLVYLTRK